MNPVRFIPQNFFCFIDFIFFSKNSFYIQLFNELILNVLIKPHLIFEKNELH